MTSKDNKDNNIGDGGVHGHYGNNIEDFLSMTLTAEVVEIVQN
jgi:hypothetical protein